MAEPGFQPRVRCPRLEGFSNPLLNACQQVAAKRTHTSLEIFFNREMERHARCGTLSSDKSRRG